MHLSRDIAIVILFTKDLLEIYILYTYMTSFLFLVVNVTNIRSDYSS